MDLVEFVQKLFTLWISFNGKLKELVIALAAYIKYKRNTIRSTNKVIRPYS